MSGRTVTDGEPPREWPLFVYGLEFRIEHIHTSRYQAATERDAKAF
jgi:hypothetical protein